MDLPVLQAMAIRLTTARVSRTHRAVRNRPGKGREEWMGRGKGRRQRTERGKEGEGEWEGKR